MKMLHVSAPPSTAQPVLLLQLSARPAPGNDYKEALERAGIALVECRTPEAVPELVRDGCSVGLLVIEDESDLARLERCEHAIGSTRSCWVGLLAEDLLARPHMRKFIAEHLFTFISLPAETAHVALALRHAWGMAALLAAGSEHPPPTVESGDDMLIGNTPPMQQIRLQIQKIARTDAPVLISGPAGSGKELVAREIHRHSARAQAPFRVINCGAPSAHRFDAALAGDRQGGTLFLDRVDELPAEAQVYLLHFLGAAPQAGYGDTRVIAASANDLSEAVHNGRFRSDLYYRLNVMSLTTPPLAHREPDIEAIARHYFERFGRTHNRSLRGFSKAAMSAMLAHAWPGNVRELINRIQRATTVAEGRFIQPEDLGLERPDEQSQLLTLEEARAAAERAMIRRALAQSRNRISRAAALLGVSRVTLYRLLEKYNIRPDNSTLPQGSLQTAERPRRPMHD